MRIALFASLVLGVVFALPALGDDWPQWLGPQRDSVWREDGIVEKFPEQGFAGKVAKAGRVGLLGTCGRGRQSVRVGLRQKRRARFAIILADAEN